MILSQGSNKQGYAIYSIWVFMVTIQDGGFPTAFAWSG